MAMAAEFKNGFVAGALALVDEPRSQPPDQRMEPEDGLDEEVNTGGQVVSPARVM